MEFLDKSVLPQSAHHMVLLKYLIVVAFAILIPYLSLLLGNLIYSLYFRRRAIKEKNEFFYRLSEDLIEMITFNRSVAFALGLIPLLSAMFGYAQLLNHTSASVEDYLFVAALFLFNAQLLIYSYKKGFFFKLLHEEINATDSTDEELRRNGKSKKAVRIFGKSGIYGFILLLSVVYVFCFAVQLASDSAQWESINSIWSVIFSLNAIVLFVQFLLSAILISSSMVLYRFFRNNSGIENYNEEHKSIIKDFVLKRGLIASVLLPLFVVLSVMMRSKFSLSYGVFGYTVLALCLILFVSSLFYIMIKESSARYNAAVLYLMIVIVFVLVIRDQYSFDVSTKKQFAVLAADYDAYEIKIKEMLGIGEVPISGADIFNGRCIACHGFDKKIVGPPYNSTMPKYEGKKDLLVKFILNPVKVNPDYPAMPNQGLKPKEAEAIAEYLLNTYKKTQ